MRTKEAKVIATLWAMELSGVFVKMYRNGDADSLNLDEIKSQYRHNVRLNLADTLGKNLLRAIERQNRKNGRAELHPRTHRTLAVNMSEKQDMYHDAKGFYIEEWQECYCKGERKAIDIVNAAHVPVWREDYEDNSYNHPYVREVMADCMY